MRRRMAINFSWQCPFVLPRLLKDVEYQGKSSLWLGFALFFLGSAWHLQKLEVERGAGERYMIKILKLYRFHVPLKICLKRYNLKGKRWPKLTLRISVYNYYQQYNAHKQRWQCHGGELPQSCLSEPKERSNFYCRHSHGLPSYQSIEPGTKYRIESMEANEMCYKD